jgi:hypothetical protein
LITVLILTANFSLVSGRAAPQWDAADFFGPAFSLISDHIKAGRLLFWNPWVDAGSPDFAEPEFGTTSPLVLLIGAITTNAQAGFVAYWMIVWLIGGIGFLVFAKHLQTPIWGAVVASLGFSCSGFYTGHAEHVSSLYSFSLLPWMLWRLDVALQNRRGWAAVQAGALYGLSGLGGYPQFTILTPLFLCLWTMGRIVFLDDQTGAMQEKSLRERLSTGLILLLLVGAVGVAVFSPPYLGTVAGTRGFSDRVGYRSKQEAISSNILPHEALTTFASPYLPLLNIPPSPIWPRTDVSMSSIYIGAASLVLCFLSLFRKSPWRWCIAIIAALFLACSVGNDLPVRGWVYELIIPTRFFRNPALFSTYSIFCVAILATQGARDLSAFKASKKPCFLWCCVSMAVLASFFFVRVVESSHKTLADQDLALCQLALSWFGMVAIAGYSFWMSPSLGAIPKGLIVLLSCCDAILTLHISRPVMYTSGSVLWWHAMNASHVRTLNLTSRGMRREFGFRDSPLAGENNRNLAPKIATLQNYVTFKNRFAELIGADPALREMALGGDRTWFCLSAVSAPPINRAFEFFSQKVHELGRPILLTHTPNQMKALSKRTDALRDTRVIPLPEKVVACDVAKVLDLSYKPNSMNFVFKTAQAGWLLTTDRWAPDWQVTLNDHATSVYGGNFIFRAIRVDSGINRIRFSYRPTFFVLMLCVSWTMLILIAAVEIGRIWKWGEAHLSHKRSIA